MNVKIFTVRVMEVYIHRLGLTVYHLLKKKETATSSGMLLLIHHPFHKQAKSALLNTQGRAKALPTQLRWPFPPLPNNPSPPPPFTSSSKPPLPPIDISAHFVNFLLRQSSSIQTMELQQLLLNIVCFDSTVIK